MYAVSAENVAERKKTYHEASGARGGGREGKKARKRKDTLGLGAGKRVAPSGAVTVCRH